MRAPQQWERIVSGKGLSKKHVLVGGISTIVVIAAATAGTAAYNGTTSQSLNDSSRTNSTSETKTQVNISDDQLKAESTTTPAEDIVSESYVETDDGQSKTRRYSTSTQDKSGNTTTQEHSYTTNIDGSSAVDINLNSSSTSTGSVDSNSSVNVDVNSSSSVRSSGQE